MSIAPSAWVVTTKNVSKHCQMSLGLKVVYGGKIAPRWKSLLAKVTGKRGVGKGRQGILQTKEHEFSVPKGSCYVIPICMVNKPDFQGAWVAQSVKCLGDSWFRLRSWSEGPEIKPHLQLHAPWAVCLGFTFPLPLPLPLPSLSKINK